MRVNTFSQISIDSSLLPLLSFVLVCDECVCLGLEVLFSSYTHDGYGAIMLVDPRRGALDQLVDSFTPNGNTGKLNVMYPTQEPRVHVVDNTDLVI